MLESLFRVRESIGLIDTGKHQPVDIAVNPELIEVTLVERAIRLGRGTRAACEDHNLMAPAAQSPRQGQRQHLHTGPILGRETVDHEQDLQPPV